MEFCLLEVKIYDRHWWISFLYFDIKDRQIAGFHIEHDQGTWKWDFLGLWNLVHWFKYREER